MEVITISANNREEVIVLPHTPIDITIEEPQNNGTYEGLSFDLNIIGNLGLKTLEISSFFPTKRLPFMPPESSTDPNIYINFFQKWRNKHYPIRFVWTKNDGTERLNMACTIDNFSYTVGRLGDVSYMLSLREYRFVVLNGKLAQQ